jgi:cytochrome P450
VTRLSQEILRLHPVVADIPRVSAKDDVLPLANPITTRSGKVIRELPIPKGLRLTLSFYAYQTSATVFLSELIISVETCFQSTRNEDLWSQDALVFNPDRWLERREKSGALIGVYANL